MPSGGARSRSGPPPDPNALRRDRDKAEWTHLPAAREGDLPSWPLDRPAQRELALWEAEWRRPQAVMWERLGQHLEVASYVRTLVRFEADGSSVALGALLRGQMTDLGLNVPGLRSNRWIIDPPEAQTKDGGRRRASPDKARFTSIEGGRATG